MGARSRRKGIAWELDCAKLLQAATGLPYRRVLTEARDGNVGDVDAPGSPFTVQCKVGAAPSPYRALREAEEAAGGSGRVPLAIIRRNGRGSTPPADLAVLPLRAFLGLVARLEEGA